MIRLHKTVAAGFVATLALAAGAAVAAQAYPSKPIRMVVPYAPGGNTDILARAVAQRMTENWNIPIIVDNRAGGNGFIAADIAAKADPDGHTVLVGSSREIVINPHLFDQMPYDPKKDFEPVTLGTISANLFAVHPSSPVKSMQDIVSLAKSKPGAVSIGTPGIGTPMHLSLELLKMRTGASMINVPYKGGGPTATALISGQEVKIGIVGMGPVMPHIRAGRIKPIAITLSSRSSLLPDVPTVEESGIKDFDTSIWFAYYVPARTPKSVVAKLNAELVRILKLPDVVKYLEEGTGVDVRPGTPADLARFTKAEEAKYGEIIRAANIKAQ